MNHRTNEYYDKSLMQRSGGQLSLQIYGFEDLPVISNGDELQNVAFNIDKKLKKIL